MGNTIEIAAASNLVGSYHAMFDGILNSTAGQLITKVGAAAAVILALGLILGGISKMLGRTNKLVTMFCPSAARIVVVLAVIFIFAGPTVTIPALLTALDWIVNAVGRPGQRLLRSLTGEHIHGRAKTIRIQGKPWMTSPRSHPPHPLNVRTRS